LPGKAAGIVSGSHVGHGSNPTVELFAGLESGEFTPSQHATKHKDTRGNENAIGMPQGQEQQGRKLVASSREVRSQDGKGGNRKQDRCSPQTTEQEEQIRARSKTRSKARNKAIVQTNFWRG
jgi:1,4-alpha-glucan branching enzyme